MSGHTGILLEDINHKLDALLEGQIPLAPMARKIDNIDERLIRVENDMQVVKKVLREHSRELKHISGRVDNHHKRITKLETA